MRDAYAGDMSDELTTRCGFCGVPIEQGRSRGNPREYCSDSHRVMACRRRQRGESIGWWNALATDGRVFRGGVHPVTDTDPVRFEAFVNVWDGTIHLGDYATWEEAGAAFDEGLKRYPSGCLMADVEQPIKPRRRLVHRKDET